MSHAFADTGFWIALLNPRDSLHQRARGLEASDRSRRIVTTEMVLAEFMNDLGSRGAALRRAASAFTSGLRANERVTIVPQTSDQFWSAAQLFNDRVDKDWSLTDCASFLVMRQEGIIEAFTHDHHFEQMGFHALLREG